MTKAASKVPINKIYYFKCGINKIVDATLFMDAYGKNVNVLFS